jgi:hypothetical protein
MMNIFACCFRQVLRFFTNPHKPMILALSRPDPKKNVTTLLKAYGESRKLRELANLVGYQATLNYERIVIETTIPHFLCNENGYRH